MVTLETPHDPDRMASFLNIRVADIEGSTPTGAQRGPVFLTLLHQRATEIRCYLGDPDGR
ncbi:MAG TPA: hypothetical protein VGI07_02240 [Solirubrobacteraceae bacterium]|jgi:hypothetical protein